jgi:hypothetical protein
MKALARGVGIGALIVAAVGAVAVLGPALMTTPERLTETQGLIARIWWPATALRGLVYLGWAVGIHVVATRRGLARPARRAGWAFLALAAIDGVVAQLPFALLYF